MFCLKTICSILNFPYFLFKKILPYKLYRYLAVAGLCFFFNFIVFHLIYYGMANQIGISSSMILGIACSSIITLWLGFKLNQFYVFPRSTLKYASQKIRYVSSNLIASVMSALILRYLVEVLKINLTLSFFLSIICVQSLNFFIQNFYSFKKDFHSKSPPN